MGEPDVFVNEETGETMSLASYVAEQRRLERDVTRLDVAIETHKEGLKAAKDGRERAIRDLRSTIREIKFLRGDRKKSRRRSKTKKGAPAKGGKITGGDVSTRVTDIRRRS